MYQQVLPWCSGLWAGFPFVCGSDWTSHQSTTPEGVTEDPLTSDRWCHKGVRPTPSGGMSSWQAFCCLKRRQPQLWSLGKCPLYYAPQSLWMTDSDLFSASWAVIFCLCLIKLLWGFDSVFSQLTQVFRIGSAPLCFLLSSLSDLLRDTSCTHTCTQLKFTAMC